MTLVCGVDVGTQGSKAGIYDVDDGTLLGAGYAEHVFDYPRPGWVEMDPHQIVDAACTAIAAAADDARQRGATPTTVAGVALSGILCGPVFIDDEWQPVRPLIPYLDERSTAEVAWITAEVEPRWIAESANAAVDTYVMAAIHEWVARNEPAVAARIAKILSLAPYVGGCLAGLTAADAYTDPSHLSGWIIGWNAATGQPSPEQLADLRIPLERAPEVIVPWDVVGTLSTAMARRTGLTAGTPICAGAGDVMQSNLGAGLVRPGLAVDVAGTASILTVGVDGPRPALTAVPGMLYSVATLPGQALYWGYVKAGGMSLRWFRDEIAGAGGDDGFYGCRDVGAATVGAGSDGVLFLPYLSGGNPDNPHASGTWLGMSAATGVDALWRSMLESIAYEYGDFLDVFAANGAAVTEVLAVGGGAGSPLWNQIKADVIGKPWRVPSRGDGAILADAAVAALGVGLLTDVDALVAAITHWVGAGEAHLPEAAEHQRYRAARAARAELLGPMREVFSTVARLRDL